MLGGGIITAGHAEAWDHVSLTAGFDAWHHVAMVYNGAQLLFYLDGVQEPHSAADTGDLVSVVNPMFIGQAGTGSAAEFFVGLIDEVKVFTIAITNETVAAECGCDVSFGR